MITKPSLFPAKLAPRAVQRIRMGSEISEPEISTVPLKQSHTDLPLRYFCYAVLLTAMVIFAVVRVRLRHTPLQRDEGEYAYAGQLMLQGIPPYQLAYNMKLPGTYIAYAVMMAAFGQTVAGIRMGMLVVLLANTLLVFLLTRRLFGLLAGTVAATSYTLLANRWSTLALDGHATHFIALAALAGTILLLDAVSTQRKTSLFFSGVCFGLAFLMKQHGITFTAFAVLFWIWSEWKQSASWRRLISRGSILTAGIVLPYLITCLLLWHAGVFRQFWFWTVHYGAAYEKILSLSEGWKQLKTTLPLLPRPAVIWLLAGFGLTSFFWSQRAREYRAFVLSFTFFSILAVFPGLYFRPHYFLVILPAVAMLAGLGISASYEYLRQRNFLTIVAVIPIVFFVLSYLSVLRGQRIFLFRLGAIAMNQLMYPEDGFPDALTISDYIRNHTAENDRIAVLASEPEIYFYSKRHSATGYMYMYPMLEKQKFALQMQSGMEREVEQSRPKLIIYTDNLFKWGCATEWPESDPDPGMNIFMWMHDYLDAHYDLMAELPIHSHSGSPCSYFVYQRR
jgi:MFS family permease